MKAMIFRSETVQRQERCFALAEDNSIWYGWKHDIFTGTGQPVTGIALSHTATVRGWQRWRDQATEEEIAKAQAARAYAEEWNRPITYVEIK